MKHTNLSSFQKEQYTSYLETQLQKFSAFMLSQKKQNEQYKQFESILAHHSNLIQQLQHKVQRIDFYQHQFAKNQENLFRKQEIQGQLEGRVRRLEDRERFGCDREDRRQRERRDQERDNQRGGESSYVNLNKRLKIVEERINKIKDASCSKVNINSQVANLIDEHTQYRVKRAQKKLKKYFANKLEDIEILMKKSKKRRSKSPSARTPIEMSTMSRYQIDQSVLPSTQFRLEDSSKQEMSTFLRDSKNTTISNKRKGETKESKKKKKNKDKECSKSRSKSKSQRKEKSKSRKKDKKQKGVERSVSWKSRDISYSHNLSDNSILHSSISKSKSNFSRSRSNISKDTKNIDIKPKKSKKHKKVLSFSHSKSNHSCSPSLHQKCKKRQQFQQFNPYTKHIKPSKQNSQVVQKRKNI